MSIYFKAISTVFSEKIKKMIVYLFPFTGQFFAFCVLVLIFLKNGISSSDGIDDGHEVLQADGTIIAGHALLRPAGNKEND